MLARNLLQHSTNFIIVKCISTQAVSFDVGGTLIEPFPSIGQIYASVAAENGFQNLSAKRIQMQFESAWARKNDFDHSEKAWRKMVQMSFTGLIESAACDQFFPELYRRFEDADVWHIHEDVLMTLDELAGRGFRLAIISNWNLCLRPLLKNLGLATFFETISISSEIGFAKPSPVPFEHTLKRLGLPARAMIHVGDSINEDIEGANNACISGILIDRKNVKSKNTISRLDRLSSILKEAW